jgi:hypothetical protein
MNQFSSCIAVGLVALASASAQAHFLFIRIEPATGGAAPQAHVFFSEQATAGDPQFVDKIAATKLWQASAAGRFEPLAVHKLSDRLTAAVKESGPGVVVGVCEYGVLSRNVPFLLRYYPKAIVGDPRQSKPIPPREKGAPEIVGTFDKDAVTFVVMKEGKPVPEAVFITVDEDLNNEEIKADATGRAIWRPKADGYYCVYTKLVTQQAGEAGGKAYVEIREFPTLAFPWRVEK